MALAFTCGRPLSNRDGEVCAVTFSGDDRSDQWSGSRVISAQKANTANLFTPFQATKFGGGSLNDGIRVNPGSSTD